VDGQLHFSTLTAEGSLNVDLMDPFRLLDGRPNFSTEYISTWSKPALKSCATKAG